MLTLILIFSQNIDEFEKQVQTLESVHPLISTRNTDKLGCASYSQPACLYLEIRGRAEHFVAPYEYESVDGRNTCYIPLVAWSLRDLTESERIQQLHLRKLYLMF